MHSTVTSPRLNADEIREQVRGHWSSVLLRLAIHVPPSPMQHGPCLRVGETIAFALMTKTGGERGFATSVVLKLGMALTW